MPNNENTNTAPDLTEIIGASTLEVWIGALDNLVTEHGSAGIYMSRNLATAMDISTEDAHRIVDIWEDTEIWM